jgi:hypothetical protein
MVRAKPDTTAPINRQTTVASPKASGVAPPALMAAR